MSVQGKIAIREYYEIKRWPEGNEANDALDLIAWLIKYEKIILNGLDSNAPKNVIPINRTNPKGTQ